MKKSAVTACCFTGHLAILASEIPRLCRRLRDGICYLHSRGVTVYYAGGALGFDTLAAEAVLDCRSVFPDIQLAVVMPCRDQGKYWRREEIQKYEGILAQADRVVCLSEHYTKGCMQRRNRYLVEHSTYCICYLDRTSGGTAYTVYYAKNRGLTVYNLKGK